MIDVTGPRPVGSPAFQRISSSFAATADDEALDDSVAAGVENTDALGANDATRGDDVAMSDASL